MLSYKNLKENTLKKIGDKENFNNADFEGEIAGEQEFPNMVMFLIIN